VHIEPTVFETDLKIQNFKKSVLPELSSLKTLVQSKGNDIMHWDMHSVALLVLVAGFSNDISSSKTDT